MMLDVTLGQEITIIDIVLRLLISTVLGTIIGIDRELNHKPAGLRTHCLVVIGATIIAIIERVYTYEIIKVSSPEVVFSAGRIIVGVITGIGFLGAGTISMRDNILEGLTTAASVWCTACVGLAVGLGYYLIAIIAIGFIMLVLVIIPKEMNLIKKIKTKIKSK